MLKREKITILFSLFYNLKRSKIYSSYSNFKFVKLSFLFNFNKNALTKRTFNFLSLFDRSEFFFISVYSLGSIVNKNKIYFCFKLHLRTLIISFYFKKVLLFTVFRFLKKKIRTKKKLELLYKKKGLIFGVRKIVR